MWLIASIIISAMLSILFGIICNMKSYPNDDKYLGFSMLSGVVTFFLVIISLITGGGTKSFEYNKNEFFYAKTPQHALVSFTDKEDHKVRNIVISEVALYNTIDSTKKLIVNRTYGSWGNVAVDINSFSLID